MITRGALRQVDPVLTNLSIAYANRPDAYIANQIFPFVPTSGKRSGRYRKFTKENFRNYDDARAPLTMGNQIKFDLDTDGTFKLVDRALWDGVDEKLQAEFVGEMNLEQIAMQYLVDARMVAREVRVAAIAGSGTYLTQTSALTGNDRWDVYTSSSSNPLEDVKNAKLNVFGYTGVMPNTVYMDYQVYEALKLHPLIKEQIKYVMATTGRAITPQLLAGVFDVEKVLVGYPLYITTKEGQSITLGSIWGKICGIAYINPNPSNMSRTLGFSPTYYGGGAGHEVENYYDQNIKAQIIRINADEDEVLVDLYCGYLFTTVIT